MKINLLLVGALLLSVSCAKKDVAELAEGALADDSLGTGDSVSNISFPAGLAITSNFSASTVVAFNEKGAFDSSSNFTAKAAAIQDVLDATSASDCEITLPAINQGVNAPSCYGPAVDVANHIGAVSDAQFSVDADWTDDMNDDEITAQSELVLRKNRKNC